MSRATLRVLGVLGVLGGPLLAMVAVAVGGQGMGPAVAASCCSSRKLAAAGHCLEVAGGAPLLPASAACHCPAVCRRFQSPGPFWGRTYLFWHNGRPLTLIAEVFSTALQELLGPMELQGEVPPAARGEQRRPPSS